MEVYGSGLKICSKKEWEDEIFNRTFDKLACSYYLTPSFFSSCHNFLGNIFQKHTICRNCKRNMFIDNSKGIRKSRTLRSFYLTKAIKKMELPINMVVIIVIALLVLVVAYFFYVKIRTSGASALESILNIPEFLKKMFGVGSWVRTNGGSFSW